MGSEDSVCRFTHASDLHIGRFQYTNSIRAMDYIEAFRTLLDSSRRASSDFILLAGDVFNSLDLLPFYFSQVVDLLRKFHQKTKTSIPIIAIEGNHDIRSFSKGNHISTNLSWLQVLSNLELITLLNQSLDDPDRNEVPLSINGINIYGNTYSGEKIDGSIERIAGNVSSNGKFNILLNHFGVEGQMKGIPGQSKYRLDKTLKSRFNYIGLGHFHRQYVLDNYIYNPGCLSPACLSDFSLPHGYFIVDVKKEQNYEISIQRQKVHEREILWKSLSIRSKPKSKQLLSKQIVEFLSRDIQFTNGMNYYRNSLNCPILCLTIRSVDGKLISATAKKELRTELLQIFPFVEVHIFQKQIAYKPIEGFFQAYGCSA